MRSIYCISGLAADHRLFKNLLVEGYELIPLPWVPFDKGDDMSSYAAKMARQVPDTTPIIIGLSFGGMLATEMAKHHPAWRIFLVSSAKTSAELSYDSRFLRWLSRKNIIPDRMFITPNFITFYNLGVHTREEKELLSQLIRESDPAFMKWSVNTLVNWKNHTYPQNIIHIHGTNDKVIRSANVLPDYWIEGGSHIMIYNRGAEVGKIISHCLS